MRKNDKKVDDLSKAFADHLAVEQARFDELKHILLEQNKGHEQFRDEVKPLVEIYTDSVGTYKVITFILKFLAIIGAGVGALIFLKKI